MMVKRLLVTGRHGFVGDTLAQMLAQGEFRDWQLAGIDPRFDLLDAKATQQLVHVSAPDAVIHLAAQSSVPESFRDPETTWRVNVFGTMNLLQALKTRGFPGRMVYVGTGDVYGRVDQSELPIAETRPPSPRNPYAASKVAAEALCMQWAASEGMEILIARPFNHIGGGQSDRFVVSALARQIVEIARGLRQPAIIAGDIDVTRDFTDVHDVVRAYFALLERGVSGECYNICSGVERSVRLLAERLEALAGVDAPITVDPARLRGAEQRRARGDPTKITTATSWVASTPIDASLEAALAHWKRALSHG